MTNLSCIANILDMYAKPTPLCSLSSAPYKLNCSSQASILLDLAQKFDASCHGYCCHPLFCLALLQLRCIENIEGYEQDEVSKHFNCIYEHDTQSL